MHNVHFPHVGAVLFTFSPFHTQRPHYDHKKLPEVKETFLLNKILPAKIFYRPGLGGAVLQTVSSLREAILKKLDRVGPNTNGPPNIWNTKKY